ncbi:MAG: carbamoyltransferase family protein [Iamia sp.]
MVNVLGVSAYYHDAAAALVQDGQVVAAAQEERFSRIKNDAALPVNAIEYCLGEAGVGRHGIDAVAYYEKPITSFVRVLKTFAAVGPRGARTFPRAMGEMVRRKLWVAYEVEKALRSLGFCPPKRTVYAEHHVSHASAAYYPSPFPSACILTFDGVGEWATSSIGVGRGRRVELLQEMRFPHSIGLLYSAFTAAAGFKVNSGEYKLMGLAPFGEPTYRDVILDRLIDLRDDGSFTADLSYFDYLAGRRMTNRRFDELVGGPPRAPGDAIEQRHCDLARSIQEVVEEIVLRIARHAHELTGESRAVLGGGVALNCVANGRLLREGPFDEIWVQPAPGDAGSALGCALWASHEVFERERPDPPHPDGMAGARLGPAVDADVAAAEFGASGRPFQRLTDPEGRARRVAELVAGGATIGVVQGRMEFGPRALGNRSILADARDPCAQSTLNLRIKHRESFRPFAPAVLAERAKDWFAFDGASPYMSFVAGVCSANAEAASTSRAADLTARLREVDSPLPAVTHVDGSARLQTVTADGAPELHRLLVAFEELTGCPVLLNTSFNVRGEPIVCSAEDAYRCFMLTDLDYLLVEDCLFDKADQPIWTGPDVERIED